MNSASTRMIWIGIFLFALMASFASADMEEFADAKKLIDAKTSCQKLSEGQLEAIGDYFMEQMHPGTMHEVLDEMLGGEGSENLRQFHISLAKRMYCNDAQGSILYGYGGMMGLGYQRGMMGYASQSVYGPSMMRGSGYDRYGGWTITRFLVALLLIGLVILVYLWIWKMIKEQKPKGERK